MAENFTFTARFEAKPGSEQRLQQALPNCVPSPVAEEGRLAYPPYFDLAEPRRAILAGRRKDNASLEYHLTTRHFKKLQQVSSGVLVRPSGADMRVDCDETPSRTVTGPKGPPRPTASSTPAVLEPALARGAGPGFGAAEPYSQSGQPIASGMSRYRARGGLQVVPGDYDPARRGSRLGEHSPPETPTALAALRGSSMPSARLLWAAAVLVEVIADDAPGDPDAALTQRDLGTGEPDRVLVPALIRVALALLECHAGHRPAEAALVSEVADLLDEATRPVARPGQQAWPGEPLTQSETRILRYLPTHLGAPEIAAELYLSANTVKTHLRHLYRKLDAHSRHEAVQRARAIGLLTGSSRRP